MKMLSESLLEGRVKDPDKKQRFLATIAGESEKLSQLIERVIYFVRLGQNALVYNRTKINAVETVRNSVDSFKARYRNKAPQIDLRLPESIPPVSADKGAVTQVLLNLLDNAARYGWKKPGMQSQTGEGNEFGAARISVRVQAETRKKNLLAAPQQWVRFDVTDFGPGIARFQRRRIFRRYYRAQETKQSNISGVGLGLALCSHIVRAHGGWMEVRSQTGKGSTFSFYLPGG
jgi:two-component system phosphate regulon sensor histidine kinase PhoR